VNGALFSVPAALVVLIACSGGVSAQEKVLRESIEWSDIWVEHANEDDLPRVLLVGDSIARGYFGATAKALEGTAYCARYTTSKFIGHADFLEELQILLKAYRFDVIHINNGLHGWDYTEEEYAQSLPELFDTLEQFGEGAVVIWATTTPVRNSEDVAEFDPKTERVRERNRIAVEFMEEHDVPINDLFEMVAGHPTYHSRDGVHFGDEGRTAQGMQVAQVVSEYLPGFRSDP
jgi:hypothetical protein